VLGQCLGHARWYGKTVARELLGRLQQCGPGLAAVGLVGQLQHPHHAGHAYGAATAAQVGHGRGGVRVVRVLAQQVVGCGGSGRGFAAIVGMYLACGGVKVQQKRPAAQAARLRLHQPQHRLYGHGSVHCRAACAQHGAACWVASGVLVATA